MAVPRAQVTYAGPALFLSSDHWSLIRAAIKRNLPLNNVLWKPASRPSIRTVQELNIDLVSFDSIRDEQFSQIPSVLVEKPLLNIYFATCEVSRVSTRSVLMGTTNTLVRRTLPGQRHLQERGSQANQRLAGYRYPSKESRMARGLACATRRQTILWQAVVPDKGQRH